MNYRQCNNSFSAVKDYQPSIFAGPERRHLFCAIIRAHGVRVSHSQMCRTTISHCSISLKTEKMDLMETFQEPLSRPARQVLCRSRFAEDMQEV